MEVTCQVFSKALLYSKFAVRAVVAVIVKMEAKLRAGSAPDTVVPVIITLALNCLPKPTNTPDRK